MLNFKIFLCLVILIQGFCDEHPRYTAARLTDQLKNLLEGNLDISNVNIFSDTVHVEDCDTQQGDLEYLKSKIISLSEQLLQTSMLVKFAYPIPYTNNSIQFTVDQILVLKNGEKSENELVIFAKTDEGDENYKIFEFRQTPC